MNTVYNKELNKKIEINKINLILQIFRYRYEYIHVTCSYIFCSSFNLL